MHNDRSTEKPGANGAQLCNTLLTSEGRWRSTSVMNGIIHEQNENNDSGRSRFNRGILNPSPRTKYITPDSPGDTLDFIYAPEFLDQSDCKLLTDAAMKLERHQKIDGVNDPYWKGRVLFFADIAAAFPEVGQLMRYTQDRVLQKLERAYDLESQAYADTIQLVQWREGMWMNPHADRAFRDGQPHGTPHRDFASILYLNDDFDGGEVYFTALDTLVKPGRGTLVAFTGGWHHEHAVLSVTKGLRLTMPAFYTLNPEKRDRTVYL